jgi:NAD(P)H-hydrate repair Nnr-like enzyme with NAD(P)H-hydrate dehydratase domain
MQFDYWLKGDSQKKLFKELEWEKPERRDQRGKLVIIGGTAMGFSAVAGAYAQALKSEAGQVRVVVPDALKPMLQNKVEDVLFTPSNKNGAFSKDAENELKATSEWADMMLFIGDSGRNSETSMVFEDILKTCDTPRVITRDAIDMLMASPGLLLENENTTLVASFSQLQKLLRSAYFTKNILFTMHLTQLVEVLHKVSLSYDCLIMTYHSEYILITHQGKVATIPFSNPMSLWRGEVATRLAVKLMQHPHEPFEAAVASIQKPQV